MGLAQLFQRGAISERLKRRWFRAIDAQDLDTLRQMIDRGFDLAATWLKLFDQLRVQACVDELEKDTPGVSTPKLRPRL